MSFFTATAKVLGSTATPLRALSLNTSKQIRMFKGIKSIKCNDLAKARKYSSSRFNKGNYRMISLSCQSGPKSFERFCLHPKPVPIMLSQFMDECRLNGGYIAPIVRYPGFPGMAKKIYPMASQWRLYAQAKEPDNPAPSKGGPVTSSGGGLGRLDAANEHGFFHKINKSRMEQIKQMLRNKSLMKGSEGAEKKEPK